MYDINKISYGTMHGWTMLLTAAQVTIWLLFAAQSMPRTLWVCCGKDWEEAITRSRVVSTKRPARSTVWGIYLLQDVFQLPFLALLAVDVDLVVVGTQREF